LKVTVDLLSNGRDTHVVNEGVFDFSIGAADVTDEASKTRTLVFPGEAYAQGGVFTDLAKGKAWQKIEYVEQIPLVGVVAPGAPGVPVVPTQMEPWLHDMTEVTREASETIGDIPTTRYSATLDLSRFTKDAPELPEGGRNSDKAPAKVWVDGEGLARRVVIDDRDKIGTAIKVQLDYLAYGVKADLRPPAPAEVAEE
jgi:hypothetical protein